MKSAPTKSRFASLRLILLLSVAGVVGYLAFQPEGSDTGDADLARPVKRARKLPEKRLPVVAEKPVLMGISRVEPVSAPRELQPPSAPIPLPRREVAEVSTPPAARDLNTAVAGKIARYAGRLLARYDLDGNGRLEQNEWSRMRGDPGSIDLNGDGILSVDELVRHVADYGRSRRTRLVVEDLNEVATATPAGESASVEQPAATVTGPATTPTDPSAVQRNRKFAVSRSRLPQGLPEWFLDRDSDGDAQLTLTEFAAGNELGQQEEFRKLDLNSDGLLTASEYVRAASAKAAAKTTSANGAPTEESKP